MHGAPRTVCFVSDRTGVTTETVGHAWLSRFDGMQFESLTMPFVLSLVAARAVVTRIDAIAAAQQAKPIVFCTIVDEEVRGVVKRANALVIDLFSNIVELEKELDAKAGVAVPAMHGAMTD